MNNGCLHLHKAALAGQTDIVKFLVNSGQDVNAVDEFGNTPLHCAVSKGYLDVARHLIEKGAYINAQNADGLTSINCAFLDENLELIEYLLKKGASFDNPIKSKPSLLHEAVSQKRLDVVTFLIAEGHNLHTRDPLGATPLHVAAMRNLLPIVKSLIAGGHEVNAYSYLMRTPLHWAIRHRCIKTVKFLLQAGASINARDYKGNTPLHFAAMYGTEDIIQDMLARRPNTKVLNSENKTPSQVAEYCGNADVLAALQNCTASSTSAAAREFADIVIRVSNNNHVDLDRLYQLLSNGADINMKVKDDKTALILAVECGHVDLVKFLLDNGADPDLGDSNGFTPLRDALYRAEERSDLIDCAMVLIDAGARLTYCDYIDGKLGQLEDPLTCALNYATRKALDVPVLDALIKKLCHSGGSFLEDMEWPPLLCALLEGVPRYFKVLIECGAQFYSIDDEPFDSDDSLGYFYELFFENEHAAVKAFVEAGGDIHTGFTRMGNSVCYLMILSASYDESGELECNCAPLISEFGFDPCFVNRHGRNLLHALVSNLECSMKLLRILIDDGCDPNLKDDGDISAFSLFVSVRDQYFDPFGVASNEQIVAEGLSIFREYGVDCSALTEFGEPVLFDYVALDATADACFLKELGSDVNLRDLQGRNLLHRCFSDGPFHPGSSKQVDDPDEDEEWDAIASYVQSLLDCGIDVNAPDNKGETPLHYAMKTLGSGNVSAQILLAILDAGAQPNVLSQDKRSPLALCKSPTLFAILAERGGEIIGPHVSGEKVSAVTEFYLEHAKIYPLLEPYALSVASLIAKGDNVLQALCKTEDIYHFDCCIKHGVNPDIRSIDGSATIHWAAQNGATNIITRLAAAHADLDLPNQHGQAPFYIARNAKHRETANYLENSVMRK